MVSRKFRQCCIAFTLVLCSDVIWLFRGVQVDVPLIMLYDTTYAALRAEMAFFGVLERVVLERKFRSRQILFTVGFGENCFC